MGEPDLSRYPDTPLKLAMQQRSVSIRALAKRLDPDADEKKLSNLRQQIRGWLNESQPQPDNARRLAYALGLPVSYFVKESTPRSGVRAELAELRERLEALESRERQADPPRGREASGQR